MNSEKCLQLLRELVKAVGDLPETRDKTQGQELLAAYNAAEDFVSVAEALIQVHWQNPKDRSETEFIAQGGGFETPLELNEWIERMFTEHRSKCPDGWEPMVCDWCSDLFLKAVKQVDLSMRPKVSFPCSVD